MSAPRVWCTFLWWEANIAWEPTSGKAKAPLLVLGPESELVLGLGLPAAAAAAVAVAAAAAANQSFRH